MKQLILVVEDKTEEQAIAKKAVLESGHKIIIASSLKKADELVEKFSDKLHGIITDIHFPIGTTDTHCGPNGLSVVLTAIHHSIPCAVCTDDVSHGAAHIPHIVGRMELVTGSRIPVSGSKDWYESLAMLLALTQEA